MRGRWISAGSAERNLGLLRPGELACVLGAARSLMHQVDALDAVDTMAVCDRLTSLGLPARAVVGTTDRSRKLEYGERLAGDLGTTLTRIEGGKHFTPEDHPDVVAAAINELLPAAHPLPTEEHT